MKNFFAVILGLCSLYSSAQKPSIQWDISLSQSHQPSTSAKVLPQTNDGGFVVSEDVSNSTFLSKINKNGQLLWRQEISVTSLSSISFVQNSQEEIYVLGHFVNAQDSTRLETGMLKMDKNGVLKWKTLFNKSTRCCDVREYNAVTNLQLLSDGTCVVIGFERIDDPTTGNQKLINWMFKVNSSGHILWYKTIGEFHTQLLSMHSANDGGFVVAVNPGYAVQPVNDYVIVKYNAQGEFQWKKQYGGAGIDAINAIQQTDDGGFIAAGHSNSINGDVTGNHGDFDFWIVKLTSQGNLEWQRSYGGTADDRAYAIQQTDDGGYIVAGSTNSSNGDVSANHGNFDVWLLKLTTEGQLKWQNSYGGSGTDAAMTVQETSDNGFVFAGLSSSVDGDVSNPSLLFKSWIVKVKETMPEHFHVLPQNPSFENRKLLSVTPPYKLCADGSEVSLFKFSGENTDYTKAGIELFGNPDNTDEGANLYGKYTIVHQSKDSLIIKYKHPNHLFEPIDFVKSSFILKKPGGDNMISLEFYHPPVLLVNGIFTEGITFNRMETELIESGYYRNTRFVRLLQYGNNALNGFYQNNVHYIPENIDAIINEVVAYEKVAVGAVDVIAHADGGILSRLYLQSKIYRGDVHKFITANTPHSGTQLANFWIQPLRQQFQCEIFSKWCNKGAIANLEVDSPFIREVLNGNQRLNPQVPSHSIVTTVSQASRAISEPPNASEWGDCGLAATVSLPEGIVFAPMTCIGGFVASRLKEAVTGSFFDVSMAVILGNFHDYVSSVESQRGGLPESCTTLVKNQYAHTSLGNDTIVKLIKELILADPLGNTFSRNGFNPPVLEPPISTFPTTVSTPTASITIHKPLSLSKYYKGSLLDIDISSTNIVKKHILISHTDDGVYAVQSTEGHVQYKFPTDSLVGRRTLTVIGKTAQNTYVTDSVSFYITDNLCDHIHVNSYMYLTGKIPNGTYTFNNIASDAIIDPGQSVVFEYIGSAVFLPGFEAPKASQFRTNKIECPPSEDSVMPVKRQVPD